MVTTVGLFGKDNATASCNPGLGGNLIHMARGLITAAGTGRASLMKTFPTPARKANAIV